MRIATEQFTPKSLSLVGRFITINFHLYIVGEGVVGIHNNQGGGGGGAGGGQRSDGRGQPGGGGGHGIPG